MEMGGGGFTGTSIATRQKEHTGSFLWRSVVNISVSLGLCGLPGSHVYQCESLSMWLTGAGQQSPNCSSVPEQEA